MDDKDRRQDAGDAVSNQGRAAVEQSPTEPSHRVAGPVIEENTHGGRVGRSLHRSTTNRWLAGVAGGLGESFGIPQILVRLTFIALSLDWPSLFGVEAAYVTYIPMLVYIGLIAALQHQLQLWSWAGRAANLHRSLTTLSVIEHPPASEIRHFVARRWSRNVARRQYHAQ